MLLKRLLKSIKKGSIFIDYNTENKQITARGKAEFIKEIKRDDSMTKKALNEKEVEQFLLLNPDFLSKNSHILNALEIVHETGGAVSLIQKQVELLRENYNSTSNNLLG